MACKVMPFLLQVTLLVVSLVSQVAMYTRVSKNGQELPSSSSNVWSVKTSDSDSAVNEGRSIKDISITVSPVYKPQRAPKLQFGEVHDHQPAKYSNFDVDGNYGKKQIQNRFVPQGINLSKLKQQAAAQDDSKAMPKPPSADNPSPAADSNQPSFADPFNFPPSDFGEDKPISRPISIDSDAPTGFDSNSPPDSAPPLDSGMTHDFKLPSYASGVIYGGDSPPKQSEYEYVSHHHPVYIDDSYHSGHDFHHDHFYEDHRPYEMRPTTTQEPEENDQRVNKQYSYYYIGRKLWYVPLYFSIYFIIYIAALVLKSVARHKINFPQSLAAVAAANGRSDSNQGWLDYASNMLGAAENLYEMFEGR